MSQLGTSTPPGDWTRAEDWKSGESTSRSPPGVNVALPAPVAVKADTVKAGRSKGAPPEVRGGKARGGGAGMRGSVGPGVWPAARLSPRRTKGASSALYDGRTGALAPVNLPWL